MANFFYEVDALVHVYNPEEKYHSELCHCTQTDSTQPYMIPEDSRTLLVLCVSALIVLFRSCARDQKGNSLICSGFVLPFTNLSR